MMYISVLSYMLHTPTRAPRYAVGCAPHIRLGRCKTYVWCLPKYGFAGREGIFLSPLETRRWGLFEAIDWAPPVPQVAWSGLGGLLRIMPSVAEGRALAVGGHAGVCRTRGKAGVKQG